MGSCNKVAGAKHQRPPQKTKPTFWWGLAEAVGFEPTVLNRVQLISSQSRYDHFDTLPYVDDMFFFRHALSFRYGTVPLCPTAMFSCASLKAILSSFGYKQFTGLFARRVATTSIRFHFYFNFILFGTDNSSDTGLSRYVRLRCFRALCWKPPCPALATNNSQDCLLCG